MKHNDNISPDMRRAIGDRLYKARREKHLTQMEVALDTGICMVSISKYETGMRVPTLGHLILLAEYYGVSAGWLIGEVG